jgi:hypothetical protein
MSMTLVLLAAASVAPAQTGQRRLADCHPMAIRAAARAEDSARRAKPERKPERRARPCIVLASA